MTWLRGGDGRVRRRWIVATAVGVPTVAGALFGLLLAAKPQVNPPPSVVVTSPGPTHTISRTSTRTDTVTHHATATRTSTAPGPTTIVIRPGQPLPGPTRTIIRTRTVTRTIAPPRCGVPLKFPCTLQPNGAR